LELQEVQINMMDNILKQIKKSMNDVTFFKSCATLIRLKFPNFAMADYIKYNNQDMVRIFNDLPENVALFFS